MESRKLQLLVRIAQIEDETVIDILEDIAYEAPENSPVLTKEEFAIVEKRLADFRANPDDFVTLEQLETEIKSQR